jgi:hypothetical protein
MQDVIEPHVSLALKGLELIVKGDGGSKIVLREFPHYYHHPSKSHDGVFVNALVSR